MGVALKKAAGRRVARWYIFKQKIPIWAYIGGPWNGKCWYFYGIWNNESPFGTFCGHLVYIFPFWYVLPSKIWQPWPAVVPSHDFTIIRVTK
jgi:hypothetical protein